MSNHKYGAHLKSAYLTKKPNLDPVEEVAGIHRFGDDVHLVLGGGGLEHVVRLYDAGVAQPFQDLDLPGQEQVPEPPRSLVLVDDLDRHVPVQLRAPSSL